MTLLLLPFNWPAYLYPVWGLNYYVIQISKIMSKKELNIIHLLLRSQAGGDIVFVLCCKNQHRSRFTCTPGESLLHRFDSCPLFVIFVLTCKRCDSLEQFLQRCSVCLPRLRIWIGSSGQLTISASDL